MDPHGTEPPTTGEQHTGWLDNHTLKSLHDINARCIDLLTKTASNSQANFREKTDFTDFFRNALLALNSLEKQRIAQTPFLLVSLEFHNYQWWLEPFSRVRKRERPSGWLTTFSRTTAVKFARATLMLAWHTGQINRDSAQIFLGIHPAVSEIIAKLSPHEIDHIAERYFHHLTPRWVDRLSIWKHIFNAPPYNLSADRNNLNTHYLQVIGGAIRK